MKNKIFYFTLLFLIVSCSKDEIDQRSISNPNKEIPITTKSLNIIQLNQLGNLTSYLHSIKNLEITDNKMSFSFGEKKSDYMIGTNGIKYIEIDNIHSYNFPIIDLNDDEEDPKILNLVIISKPSGGYKSFFVNYKYKLSDYTTNNTKKLKSAGADYIPLDIDEDELIEFLNSSFQSKAQVRLCFPQTTYICRYDSNHTQANHGDCNDWENYKQLVYLEPFCLYVDEWNTGSGGSGGSGTGGGTGGSGDPGCDTRDPDCDENPDGPYYPSTETQFEEKEFVKYFLSSADRQYYYEETSLRYEVLQFLESHLFSEVSKYVSRFVVINRREGNNYVGFEDPLQDYDFTRDDADYKQLEQTFIGQMSIEEKNLYMSMNRYQQLSYGHAAKIAKEKAEVRYPNSIQNGLGDAYRHALWNAIGAFRIGATKMRQLTTAHENQPSLYPYNFKENEMDLYNNDIGISIGDSYFSYISYEVEKALENGELKYLNSLDINRQATSASQLTPTNQ